MAADDTVTVRGLEERDHEAVHAILTSPSVIEGTMRVPYAPLRSTRERLEPLPGVHLLVAELGGAVVGFGELVTHPQHPRHAHVGEINMVCTHPDHEGRGVGRALMVAMVELADDWLNLRRLGLIVFADNAHAVRLYEQLGFEHEGVTREFGYKRGQYVDALAMGRLRP